MISNDTFIAVVTHKMFDKSIVPPLGYRVIKVGNKLSDEEAEAEGYLTDDLGDNISWENPYYCELTAHYWMWKNLESKYKYVGLSHYRRYFFDYTFESKRIQDDIISEEKIKNILKTKKVILSFPSVKVKGGSTLYKNKPDDQQDKNWVILDRIIKNDYPEMYDDFLKLMYGRFTTWGNMFITTRDIFDEYSEWLFEVLGKYDEKIAEEGKERTPRVDGFLSEHLLMIWMYHRFKKSEIYWAEVRNTEMESFIDYKSNIIGQTLKLLRSNRTSLHLLRYLRIGYLLITR